MNEIEIVQTLKQIVWDLSKPPQNTTSTTHFTEIQAIKRYIRFIF